MGDDGTEEEVVAVTEAEGVLGRPVRQVAASSTGALLTSLIATPFDVLKTRLQSRAAQGGPQAGGSRALRESLSLARSIVRREGPLALYRGLSATVVLTVPSSTLYFALYEAAKEACAAASVPAAAVAPLSGLAARVCTTAVSLPVEVVRTNVQAHAARDHSVGSARLLWQLATSGRPARLWAGWVPTTMRDVPFSVLYWTTFEETRARLITAGSFAQGSLLPNFAAGALAGSVASFSTVPFDVLKTRRQMNVHLLAPAQGGPASAAAPHASTLQLLLDIYRDGGLRALFKGWVPRVAKVAPSCAVMISTYELIVHWNDKDTKGT
jgi:solute carrier family 25 protein 39/40